MNVYLYELRSNFKFTLIWLIVIIAVGALTLSFYPAIAKDIEGFIKLMEGFPESMQVAFGMNIDAMGSVLGYYSSFPLVLLIICGSIEAMIMGVSILSKEERYKTADFLLTKPISRNKIVSSKLLSLLSLLLISHIIIFIIIYLLLLIVSPETFSFSIYFFLTFSIFMIQLIFFSLGSIISVILPKIKSPLSIALSTVFGFYALGVFGDEKMRIIMPFQYFDSSYILNNVSYEFFYSIITLIIIVISIGLTFMLYEKKDIPAV